MRPVCVVALALCCALSATFLAWTAASSCKGTDDFLERPTALPKDVRERDFKAATSVAAGNYKAAWEAFGNGRHVLNSAIVTGIALVILLSAGPMAAYALVRLPTPGRCAILLLFLAGFSVPLPLLCVPLYFLSNGLGALSIMGFHPLADPRVRLGLIDAAVFLPFTIYVLTGYMRSLPKELEEAAAIDGCSPMGTLFRVVLPTLAPALGTVAVLDGFEIWNEYLLALILLQDPAVFTLPRGLYDLQAQMGHAMQLTPIFAGIAITLVAPLVLFPLWEKRALAGFEPG